MSNLTQAESKIEEISRRARAAFFKEDASFEKSIAVAKAISELGEALTPAIMADVMKLMNSSLGFRTDQDPNQPTATNPQPKAYSMEVVREVFIEATLRGFYPINNEFNIIAGRFYGALNGFERNVRHHEKVTDFKDHFEVPRVVNEGGAIVKCKASWKQKSGGKLVPQELEREFPVRINRGMGSDAILGKAKRKLYAAVYARLTGVVTPEGDAADISDLKSAAPAQGPAETPKAEDLFGKGKK